MNLTKNKLLSSFGSKNFQLSKPSNGIYLKLICSVLSSKGNWTTLNSRLRKVSLNARLAVVKESIKKTLGLKKIITTVAFHQKPFEQINLKRAANLVLKSFKLKTLISTGQLRLTDGLERKSVVGGDLINFSLSSLRVVHSIIHPLSVLIELKSKRRGGRVFSVPIPVKSEKRRHSIFIHWIKNSTKEQNGKPIDLLLKNEFNDLLLRKGRSIDQLSNLEKTIKLNRVFLRKSQIKLI